MIRNKTLIKGFALAALVPLFAACSSEEDSLVQGGEAQPVQIDITRATTDGNDWTWENGDQLKLYVTSYGSDAPTEETLTYNGSIWSTFNATLPATVEACYLATATLTSFTIPTNQSAGIAEADYMTTASSQQLNGTNLSLTLEHRLSKVIVTITDWSDYGSTMPTVTDFHIQTKESITVNGNTVTGDGNTIDISPLQDEAAHSYTAIVAPNAGFNITLVVAGKDKTASYTGSLASGNAYSFNLTLKDTNTLGTRSAGTSDCELELVEVRNINEK